MDNFSQKLDSVIENTLAYLEGQKTHIKELLVSKESFTALSSGIRKVRKNRLKPNEPQRYNKPIAPVSPVVAPLQKEIKKVETAEVKIEGPLLEKASPVEEPPIESNVFRLEKLAPPEEEPFSEMRSLMQKLFPSMKFRESLPDDARARIKPKPKLHLSPVVILGEEENPKESEFLQNLAKAISSELAPISFISTATLSAQQIKEIIDSPEVRLFVGQTPLKNLNSPILSFYKENPSSFTCFLGEKMFLPLRPYEDYFNEPKYKRALWHSLCQILKK